MDYKYLRQQLMNNFQQLVIFDLKETRLYDVQPVLSKAIIYDLTDKTDVDLPRKYYVGSFDFKPVVVILEDCSVQDPYKDYITTVYNLYRAIVKKRFDMLHFDEIFELTKELTSADKMIHWIWFREKDFHLPDKIMVRAKSWIELNPDHTFYLWTNLADKSELDDFISKLDENNRKYFNGRIIVMYRGDTYAIVEEFYQKYMGVLSGDAESILAHLFKAQDRTVTTTSTTASTATSTTTTVTTVTTLANNYKINRIFRTDMLRIMVLNMCGGIYSDFNDTICFYPVKYLLTLYKNEYFVGTDYDPDHPIFRNNYFMYNSMKDQEFVDLSMKCINKAVGEYVKITSVDYMRQYYDICVEFLSMINSDSSLPPQRGDMYFTSLFIQSPKLKILLSGDQRKEVGKVYNLIIEMLNYFAKDTPELAQLCQRLKQEFDMTDMNHLKMFRIKQKRGRRRRVPSVEVKIPIVCDFEKTELSYDFHDYFLMKYATFMTNGDLILSTNFSFIGEMKNIVPYCRSNRLSTISMITHVYDGTSYGLDKSYDTIDPTKIDLRRDLL
jgi:hypothetical protein